MAKKTYVLDTNVILADTNCFYSFKNNDILVPLKVLQELDKHKKSEILGFSARNSIKFIDALREKGSILEGVRIGKGYGLFSVASAGEVELPKEFPASDPDNQILATALSYAKNNPEIKVILVSNDINLRIKCDAVGLACESFTEDHVIKHQGELFSGVKEIRVDEQIIERFYSGESLVPVDILDNALSIFPNEFLILVSSANEKKSCLARFMTWQTPLRKLGSHKNDWGLVPKNKEQEFTANLLLDPDVHLVTMVGKAGTGKTIVALGYGLEQLDATKKKGAGSASGPNKRYKRLIVSRPVVPMGKDIGFLPGPQPLDAKIMTPKGWVKMGELKVGDFVSGRDGKPTKILEIFPKGIKDVYKIKTTDGTSTECCEDHLWKTQTAEELKRGKEGQVRSTKEILETLVNPRNKSKLNHFLPRNDAVEMEKRELPIPPYTMGVILGDGSISGAIVIANTDLELVERVEEELKALDCKLARLGNSILYNIRKNTTTEGLSNNKPANSVAITNTKTGERKTYNTIGLALQQINIKRATLNSRCRDKRIINEDKYEFLQDRTRWENPVKNNLHKLGLSGKKSWEKFIPDDYKFSSVEDRIAILQGLMDTDGTIKKGGEASYCTTSKRLAEDVVEIIRSLGGRATIRTRNRVGKKASFINNRQIFSRRPSFEFTISLPKDINPFFISRKSSRHKCFTIHRPKIESIEKVGKKEVQCILLDSKDHLYLTDDYLVTHNTLQEKMSPWLAPVQDNLRTLMGNDEMMLEEYSNQKLIEVEALTYIRGRSIPNSYIIIDECFPGDQYVLGPNGTKHQIYDLFVETKRTGKYPKIMSYDTETHQYETDEIVSITRKELPRQLLEVQIGGFSFYPTDEHPFLSLERGWIHAKDLRVGEAVCSYGENRLSYKILSDDQEQLVYGCLLDPKFSLEQLGKTKFSISAKFNKDHESFYEPFLDVIGGNIKTLMETEKVEYFSFINNKKKLSDVRKFTSEHFYSTDVNYQGKGTHREKILELIDVRGWAVFYQNCIYNHEEHGPVFEVDYHHGPQIVNKFSSLGFECELINNTTIRFVGKSFNDFAEWVAPYFFKENVKLLPKKPPHVIAWDTKDTGRFVSLVESVEPSARKEIVYDIEVEKNHNFVVCSKYVDNFGIVVHNCQNLTRHEVKTILTRVGENSKIVLIGDIEQIDNVNLDETNNGLTYAIEKFKEETIAGHTTLTKGERSLLATRASKIL